MSTEGRRVLILGILACVLGGYAYVTAPERKTLGTGVEKKTERTVLDFTPEHVTQIDLLFDGQHLVCQRTPEGWKQSPDGAQMPPDAIEDFLTNLKKLLNLGEEREPAPSPSASTTRCRPASTRRSTSRLKWCWSEPWSCGTCVSS